MLPMRPTPLPPPDNVFTWPVRIYWEDTDAGGIVFYANYLKFFERARTEWLRAKGVEQRQLQQDLGCIFVVSDVQIKYLRSARLDDQLLVTAHLSELGRSSFIIQQEARLISKDETSVVLCTGSVRVGWINAQTSKPARIPLELQQALQR
jgi:acyl-CoA thioester hydrolase